MEKDGNKGVGNPMVRALGKAKPDRNWYTEDFQWYLKWGASVIILFSLAMRAAGIEYRMYDLYFGWVGILFTFPTLPSARQLPSTPQFTICP